MNCVFEAKCIPNEEKLVDEAKDVEGEESGNRSSVDIWRTSTVPEVSLKCTKNVAGSYLLAKYAAAIGKVDGLTIQKQVQYTPGLERSG